MSSEDAERQKAGIGRWFGVVRAGRELLGSFSELAGYLGDDSLEELGDPPDHVIDLLVDKTSQLAGAFPDVASIYTDVDRIDQKVRAALDTAGGDDALFGYLDWMKGIVDAVISRAVEVAFGRDEPRLTPARAEEILERIDELLRIVMERWVVPALLGEKESENSR